MPIPFQYFNSLVCHKTWSHLIHFLLAGVAYNTFVLNPTLYAQKHFQLCPKLRLAYGYFMENLFFYLIFYAFLYVWISFILGFPVGPHPYFALSWFPSSSLAFVDLNSTRKNLKTVACKQNYIHPHYLLQFSSLKYLYVSSIWKSTQGCKADACIGFYIKSMPCRKVKLCIEQGSHRTTP